LPAVLEGLSDREALALWWFQTKMQLEMIAGGVTINPSFTALGIDPAGMNLEGFRYHNEIMRRMKQPRPDRGTQQASIKGLFQMSRAGQHRFQDLFFPTTEPAPWKRTVLATIINLAQRTDRWLARRAPA